MPGFWQIFGRPDADLKHSNAAFFLRLPGRIGLIVTPIVFVCGFTKRKAIAADEIKRLRCDNVLGPSLSFTCPEGHHVGNMVAFWTMLGTFHFHVLELQTDPCSVLSVDQCMDGFHRKVIDAFRVD